MASRRNTSARTRLSLGLAAVLTLSWAAALPTPVLAGPMQATSVAHLTVPVQSSSVAACTHAAGATSCELWASAGTLDVADRSLPVWGFSGSADGAAGLPGPVLEATAGDRVTVTFHNGLPAAAGALSFLVPGAVQSTGPDRTGVVTGSSATYSFLADRPGSFLYEAGHTGDGVRQVAMGLFGALVVRPADASASAYGATTGTTYDDEAVLVLSEIDPALNGAPDPTSFDLRSYAPRYRLINGKVAPRTDAIATGPGHTVLLRLVNAGLQDHFMSVLGADQTVVGQDADPAPHALGATVAEVRSGSSVESMVHIPADSGLRYAVYETAHRLDNNGSFYGTSGMLDTGGMLTFLDATAGATASAAAPVTSSSGVTPAAAATGPVTVHANVSVDPSTTVQRVEFRVDDATTAPGTGTAMTLTAGSTYAGDVTVTTFAALSPGRHTAYVRAEDASNVWGAPSTASFTVATGGPVTNAQTVSPSTVNGTQNVVLQATGSDVAMGGTVHAAEYWVGTPGAEGTGTALTLSAPDTATTAESATIPASALSTEGITTVSVHSLDSWGVWGPTVTVPVSVDRTGPATSGITTSPNPTNGTGSTADPTSFRVDATVTDPVVAGVASMASGAEAFIDVPGALGTGAPLLANSPTGPTAPSPLAPVGVAFHAFLPMSQLTPLPDGVHTIYVRGHDAAGNWGGVATGSITLDRVSPAVTSFTASPSSTSTSTTLTVAGTDNASLLAKGEWWDGADPGVGRGSAFTFTPANPLTTTVVVSVAGWPVGTHTLHARLQDAAGNWSATANRNVTVTAPNLIFADGFESNGVTAWNGGRIGAATVNTAAAMNGTYGLATTVSGTASAGYVIDTTPNAEPAFHAQFQFNPHGFVTGNTGAVTLLAARNAANQTVTLVQYNRLNNGQAQIRAGALGTAGTTYTSWYGIGAASSTVAHTIRIDWSSTARSLALVIDGVSKQTLTGLTNTALRVDTTWFGVSGGLSGASNGTPYLDTFTSTRVTLP